MKVLLKTHALDLALANDAFIAKYLSRNNILYMRGETEDEFFINLIRDLSDELKGADLTEEVHEWYWTKVRNKSSSYGKILACTPILKMLVQLYPLRDYYGYTKMFQPYSLARCVVGVHGAVRVPSSFSFSSLIDYGSSLSMQSQMVSRC